MAEREKVSEFRNENRNRVGSGTDIPVFLLSPAVPAHAILPAVASGLAGANRTVPEISFAQRTIGSSRESIVRLIALISFGSLYGNQRISFRRSQRRDGTSTQRYVAVARSRSTRMITAAIPRRAGVPSSPLGCC